MKRRKSIHKAPVSIFVATTVVVFFLSLSAADSIGLVPSYIDGSTPLTTGGSIPLTAGGLPTEVSLADLPQLGDSSEKAASPAVAVGALPARISIPSVGIDLPVQNPYTTDVGALDALLQSGPARYALSAKLGEQGNMIVFAHSSHLPIVHNKMYQAFNAIPDVKPGATIIILGTDGKQYIYAAESVVNADTQSGTEIPLVVSSGAKLTLVTCDTLTGKSARFVLTADFIGTN